MDIEGVLAITFIFGGGTLFLLAISPIGKAFAERIRVAEVPPREPAIDDRDLRRVEYGDERDPAMREFLNRISPVNNAAKIKRPLFVAHGRNDPRVPYTEAEQIVETVKKNGVPVWYMLADNEGHGFARKENADFYFQVTIRFLQETVLK